MHSETCHRIAHELLRFVNSEVRVSGSAERCTVTLPMKTLDGRFVDVYVEPAVGGHVVHDGGRAASELYAQGVHLTRVKRAAFDSLAERFGAQFDHQHDTFRLSTPAKGLQAAVLAIAQCASVAMHDLLYHNAVISEVPLRNRVRRTLDDWETSEFTINHKFPLEGAATHHEFDSVAFPGCGLGSPCRRSGPDKQLRHQSPGG